MVRFASGFFISFRHQIVMARTDQLHTLIHSLDLNEKRYFKLNGSVQKKESNLIRLFDAIAKQKNYNEAAIREQFKNEHFIAQLPVTKNHLFEAIVRSMRGYYLKRDLDAQLSGMLQDVRFLFDKGLVDNCRTMLKRLRKLAAEHQRHVILLEVLEWESRLLSNTRYADADEADIDKLSEEYYEILGLLQNQREYIDLQSKIFNNYMKIGVARKNLNYKTNDQIVNQFALKDESRATTFVSKCCYLNIHALYRKINNDWEGAYKYRKALLDLLEAHIDEHGFMVPPERLFTALNNLVPICIKLNRLSEAEQYLNAMEKVHDRYRNHYHTDESRLHHNLNRLIASLTICVLRGNKEKGDKALTEAIALLNSFSEDQKVFQRLHLGFNIAYYLFADGQFSKAIRWVNNVMNDNRIRSNEDLHSTCRLLALMTHYELGKGDLLDYLAKSTERFLIRLDGQYAFEEEMLNFMRKYAKATRVGFNEQAEIQILRERLQELPFELGERNALSVIDIPRWIMSRINKCNLLQVYSTVKYI